VVESVFIISTLTFLLTIVIMFGLAIVINSLSRNIQDGVGNMIENQAVRWLILTAITNFAVTVIAIGGIATSISILTGLVS